MYFFFFRVCRSEVLEILRTRKSSSYLKRRVGENVKPVLNNVELVVEFNILKSF